MLWGTHWISLLCTRMELELELEYLGLGWTGLGQGTRGISKIVSNMIHEYWWRCQGGRC